MKKTKTIKAWAIMVVKYKPACNWNPNEQKWQNLIFDDKPSQDSVYLSKGRRIIPCKITYET